MTAREKRLEELTLKIIEDVYALGKEVAKEREGRPLDTLYSAAFALEQTNTKHLTYMGSGVDRAAYKIDGEDDFVLKLEMTKREEWENNPFEKFDAYCQEQRLYQKAESAGVEEMLLANFSPTELHIDGINILLYFQEMVDICEDCASTEDGAYFVGGEYLYSCWEGTDLFVVSSNSPAPTDEAYDFILGYINDLHPGNLGFNFKEELVIVDYAGY